MITMPSDGSKRLKAPRVVCRFWQPPLLLSKDAIAGYARRRKLSSCFFFLISIHSFVASIVLEMNWDSVGEYSMQLGSSSTTASISRWVPADKMQCSAEC